MNHQNLFNLDFFPTPEDVLQQMQIDCRDKRVLEPSAGKGNIIDYLKDNGARQVQFCEINQDLQHICQPKAAMLKANFLEVTKEEISHIDLIVMNPPFSCARDHIMHAWSTAPDGCEVISLCNADTLNRWSGRSNDELKNLIDMHGFSFSLGQCFSTAERKTDVEISCIHLHKPVLTSSNNFEGFYMDEEPEVDTSEGIMPYNEIQALVNRYMAALKVYDLFHEQELQLSALCRPLNFGSFEVKVGYDTRIVNATQFAKELQKASWKHIFSKMQLEKYLTRGVMEDINKFVETQTKVPFTVRNVYRMFEIIVGTREHSFNRALTEAVDHYTRYTHENRFGVEGWKTNAGHLLNKKFIINHMVRVSYSGKLELSYYSDDERLNDLVKVMCNLTGKNFDKITTVREVFKEHSGIEPNTWHSMEFFEFKAFKKGTMHLKFKCEDEWAMLNRQYAKIKGQVLPEKF